MKGKKALLAAVLTVTSILVHSQEIYRDTLSVTLNQADSIFLVQNLSLLAEKCNVEAAKARIIQAKLFRNLNFSISQNIFNPYYQSMGAKKYFDLTDKGDMAIQVQKLILTAGKRNKQISLAETGARREEEYYFDLIRTLKFALHSQFYNIRHLENILAVYSNEIASLSKLADAFKKETEKGNVSKKELLRIQASLFSLENEKLGYLTQLISAQSEMNILLHSDNIYIKPAPGSLPVQGFNPDSLRLQQLIDTANACRYDLRMAKTDVDISNLNLSYQKALGVPDVTVSGGWEKNGGYYHNYNFIGLQFDLPLFDRNQGNIKSAKFSSENLKYNFQSTAERVKSEVVSAYSTLLETDRLYRRFDTSFTGELEVMNGEMLKNFEKRNISLIEFLDYYDAYKMNVIQLNTLMMNRAGSIENLSFVTGKDITIK